MEDQIFREYDIRGIYGKDLTDETAYLVGKAFISLIKKDTGKEPEKLSIGMDARLHSERLKRSLIKGITESGVNVIDLGMCPTPLQYFSLFRLPLDGGIMITGSHNPLEYNGFKLSIGKETIFGEKIKLLRKIILDKDFITNEKKGTVETYDIIEDYKNFMINQFPSFEGIKLVIDSGNGTAGLVAPEIFKKLGAEVIELFSEPDGRFPNHHPDPVVPENIQILRDTVLKEKAQIGIGYDGDADRLGVIDENGNVVWGDQLMVIFARELLSKNPQAKIIGEVKCSQIMYEEIKNMGGIPIMWKTGHSLIKKKMKEENALLAGEMSGHIFFNDRYFGYDDAIYASLRLVEIMKKNFKPYGLSKLLEGIKSCHFSPEIRINCPDDKKFIVVEKFKEHFNKYECVTIDGVRINFPKGWALLRASNTQPVLVLRFEAETEEALEDIKAIVHQRLFEVFQFYKIL
ncbi:MAG: phosphomannomutase/phosphoglucomutase [Thermodesulfovibrio sp.]|uniref:phosphomannomutase/phosphoglucomutase n=1 Tax=Thermodesulfovibrio sp. N1 TaxID=1871110 RepID=UPI00083A6B8F|nr:phosphomannomutase/phosphoglucomutase [Thermodesulfovibrio sp. N1]MDI6714865.1 phosphomannomutase/phosphoglucomutase [Thermodesulfovibrio sp.]ODA44749.1 Phosphomannomutase / Phosphoglucomutase / Phosphoglucosamine mutase [Thermodesulfovibrio sp. N1]